MISWDTPLDVAYAAPAGIHRLEVAAPDCDPTTRDVQLEALSPLLIKGSLAPRQWLRGPLAAPDGVTLSLGGFAAVPNGAFLKSAGSASYTLTADPAGGVWYSTGYAHRHLLVANDLAVGTGTFSGLAYPKSGDPGPLPVNGNRLLGSFTLRLGGRLGYRSIALEAGSGIGGTLSVVTHAAFATSQTPLSVDATPTNLQGADVSWHVPLWAAITVKPFCDWGVQAMASYDVDPSDATANAFVVGAGLVWQPSGACSRAPGLTAS